jgi:predicted amidophosphoribosyltransferase
MAKKRQMCSECGAELRLGPTRCPLCGCEPSKVDEPAPISDPDGYHSGVQELRDQLRKLREEGAEAV